MNGVSFFDRFTSALHRRRYHSLALGLLAFTGIASAGSLTVWGDTGDAEVHYDPVVSHTTGVWWYDPTSTQGMVGVNGGYDYSDVFVFQLPVLPAGQGILSAAFSYYELVSGSKYNTDLYGLGFRSSSTVLASDWYSGPNDTHNTLIQSGIVPASQSYNGRVTTSAAGDVNLLAYLNAQYVAGAVAGNYVFLRLSSSAANGDNLNVNFTYQADLAPYLDTIYPGSLSYWQGLYSPRLDLTFADVQPTTTPEPSTAAGLGCGLLVWVVLRRRMKNGSNRGTTGRA
jgi:hypothetical protein